MILRIFCLLWFTACATSTGLNVKAQHSLENRFLGQVMELRYSCYYGALYDENEKLMLSPYPFVHTYHLVDLDGKPIHPRNQKGVIKAGSRFAISKIEFPNYKTVLTRMLTTPRENPWVYLQAVPTEKISLRNDRPFILVLPLQLDTEEKIKDAIEQTLAPEGEMASWMETLKPAVRLSIEAKTVTKGMTKEEMLASMGQPLHWLNDEQFRVAWYPQLEILLLDDKVEKSQNPRALAKELIDPITPTKK